MCGSYLSLGFCARFIVPGAPMEMNLSDGVRNATMASVRSLQNQVRFARQSLFSLLRPVSLRQRTLLLLLHADKRLYGAV